MLRYFRNKILPDGTLDDRASPELARIRRDIERQRRTIQESLQSYLRRLSDGGAVQDELVTIRGERFVIPVKVEQRRRVQGVAHGASSSGQTVFIEPLETIEQNNELVRLHDEEQAEIHRILLEMTARIGEQAAALEVAVGVLGELELQFAKARFAQDYDCVAVKFHRAATRRSTGCAAARRAFVLRNARHPLLERTLKPKGVAVVPLTVELDDQHRQLIISGPNTGGKTVALKTIGLMALMAQSGIPSAGRARGVADLRWRLRRYRRLPVDRAEPVDVFGARHQHRFHLASRDSRLAGAAGRTRFGHRSRRGRGAGGLDR